MSEVQIYVKGDQTRRVYTPAQRVAAVWEGFKPASEVTTEDVDYRDLQAQAKSLGIPANQGKEALVKAIAEHEPEEAPAAPTPDVDSTTTES